MPIRCSSCQSGPVIEEKYTLKPYFGAVLAPFVFGPSPIATVYVCGNCGFPFFNRDEFLKIHLDAEVVHARAVERSLRAREEIDDIIAGEREGGWNKSQDML